MEVISLTGSLACGPIKGALTAAVGLECSLACRVVTASDCEVNMNLVRASKHMVIGNIFRYGFTGRKPKIFEEVLGGCR